MKKAIALFLVLLTLTACTSNKEKNGSTNKFPEEELMEKAKDNTKLTQYVDSIKTVFPNYEGNLVVQKKVSKEFEKQLTSFPGILEGSTFHLASMFEHEGKTCVAFMCLEERTCGAWTTQRKKPLNLTRTRPMSSQAEPSTISK